MWQDLEVHNRETQLFFLHNNQHNTISSFRFDNVMIEIDGLIAPSWRIVIVWWCMHVNFELFAHSNPTERLFASLMCVVGANVSLMSALVCTDTERLPLLAIIHTI